MNSGKHFWTLHWNIQMANKHTKGYLTSLAMRKMQIETTMKCHCTPIKIAKMEKIDNTKSWQGCGGTGGNAKLNIYFSNFLVISLQRYWNKKNENICPHKDL